MFVAVHLLISWLYQLKFLKIVLILKQHIFSKARKAERE